MKHLYVDAQLFQTYAWYRGMGKISVEFLRAIIQKPAFAGWDVTLVLNEDLKDVEREKEIIDKLMGNASVVYLNLELPNETNTFKQVETINRERLDAYMDTQPNGSLFFIPALLEYAIYPVFPTNAKKVLLFHDLIPLLFAEHQLQREDLQRQYFERFGEIFKSDLIVANSDTTRDDLIRFLYVEPDKVVSVYGAGFDRGDEEPVKPKDLGDKPFVLFPSGDDYRKNNQRCVEAFAQFNAKHDNAFEMIITSGFSDGTKKQLTDISPQVRFAGVVSEGEFRWLFQNANVMFFGTEYEGLGMPLFEAMAEGVQRIVCSDIAVFHEIAEDEPVIFCDPQDPADMARALDEALTMKPAIAFKALEQFTWSRTGDLLLDAMNELDDAVATSVPDKRRIAIVGPDPRGYSSIGKFMQELHPVLSQYFECDYFFEMSVLTPGEHKVSFIPFVTNWQTIDRLNAKAYAQYDAVWYHLGNSDYHVEIAKRALAYPGYIIFHDTRLRGLFDQLEQRGHIATDRYEAELAFGGLREAECITSLANSAKGILVHSDDAYEKIAAQLITDKKGLHKLHHPIADGGHIFAAKRPSIGFGGFATPRADDFGYELLQQMLRDPRFADCDFEVFGFLKDPHETETFIGAVLHNLKDPRIRVTTNLNDLAFQDKLRSVDVLMNFRQQYSGETSRFTLEAMRYGTAVVVRDVGWYHELPDDAVCKVAKEQEILEKVAPIVQSSQKRISIARAARAYTQGLTVTAYAMEMMNMHTSNALQAAPQDYRDAWNAALQQKLPALIAAEMTKGIV